MYTAKPYVCRSKQALITNGSPCTPQMHSPCAAAFQAQSHRGAMCCAAACAAATGTPPRASLLTLNLLVQSLVQMLHRHSLPACLPRAWQYLYRHSCLLTLVQCLQQDLMPQLTCSSCHLQGCLQMAETLVLLVPLQFCRLPLQSKHCVCLRQVSCCCLQLHLPPTAAVLE